MGCKTDYFLKNIFLIKIVVNNKAKKAIIGMYIEGETIKSIRLGASKFFSITSSSPLPIETIINNDGISPKIVAQKKLDILTSNIHGKTFCI